jgi:adenylate kinase
MKVIIISGTPGTGKTTISNNLLNYINAKVISLNELVIERNFVVEYDQERETSIIDEEKLLKFLNKMIKNRMKNSIDYLIIEGHFSDMIPEEYMDLVFILRCHPDELFVRLKKRGYKSKKILENVQSEILGSCANYFISKEIKVPLFEIDTTNSEINEVSEKILDVINDNEDANDYLIGRIDWLEEISNQNRLNEFFNNFE